MAKIEIITCDCCGATNAKTFWFYVDRKLDGGGDMEDIHEPLDLCGACCWFAMEAAQKRDYTVGQKVHAEMSQRADNFRLRSKK